tara:strand:- start:95 stop:658 length:564 start_codon:yes stop_codon:yes gene_type:complete
MKTNQNFIETLKKVDEVITLLDNSGLTNLLERFENFYTENSFKESGSYFSHQLEIEDYEKGFEFLKKYQPNNEYFKFLYGSMVDDEREGRRKPVFNTPIHYYWNLFCDSSKNKKEPKRQEIFQEIKSKLKPVKDIGEYRNHGGFPSDRVDEEVLMNLESSFMSFIRDVKRFKEINVQETIENLQEKN